MAGLKKNKDLDLRRYGKNLYTKALQSGGDGSGEGSEGIADYEGVYQLYKQQLLSRMPSNIVETFIVPEHFEDVVDLEGEEYKANTPGIWSTNNPDTISAGLVSVLFTVPSYDFNVDTTYIVVGRYVNTSGTPWLINKQKQFKQ